MLAQQHIYRCPYVQSSRRHDSGLFYTLHAPLLRDIRHDTQEFRQPCAFSGPLTRGDVVCVGGELDHEIARVHSASIPLQPEAHLLLPHTIFRQRIEPQIVPLLTNPVAPFAHWPRFPPAECLS